MKFLQILWIIIFVLSTSKLAKSQSFCLSNPSINKQRTESYKGRQTIQPCKIYWINIYLHRVIGTKNGWNGYTSSIDTDVMGNLNASYNQYGFYFKLIGSRDWFTDIYTDINADPDILEITLSGIFDDKESLQHTDAIDIYLLPAKIPIKGGGFVPSNNPSVMFIGGTRTITHCTGGSTLYEIATTNVASHEMGHVLGLPHTFDVNLGTSVDYVRNRECVDPSTCQFVNNCTDCNVSSNPTTNMNNFMSYTIPNCMSAFSNEQVSLMRENLENTMASVVNRTQGLPSDIIGDLIGPSEVSKGSLVWFNLSDQGEEYETFIWAVPRGFLGAEGEDNTSSIRTWIGSDAESGNVRVWKTNLCGDSNEKYKFVTVIPDDCMDCPTINIFPNPALHKINIRYSSQESSNQELFEEPREYMIVDTNGKTVYKLKSSQTNIILDLSGIKNGFHILIIRHGNFDTFRRKFTILR